MFKRLFVTSILVLSITGIVYPSKKENTKIFDYCYSLEKILSSNLIQKRKNVSDKVKSISKDITIFGLEKTKGTLINEIIDQYKNSKNSFIITLLPNRIICLTGYWIENINPGMFESIFFEKSKKVINEFNELKELKDDADNLINDVNSGYESIKDQFENIFN